MSKLKDDEIRRIELTVHGYTRQPLDVKAFARAIEAAATEPLLQRIAELERELEEALKDAKPCPTCESLARAVMLDQAGKA